MKNDFNKQFIKSESFEKMKQSFDIQYERIKQYLEDIKNEEEIKSIKQFLSAAKDIDAISQNLVDLSRDIMTEEPDRVFFLDKGARIFAAPIMEFLRQKFGDQDIPKFNFFNDDYYKKNFISFDIHNNVRVNVKNIEEDEGLKNELLDLCKDLKGKIFIVDETFCIGRGARFYLELMKFLNKHRAEKVEFYFYALSYERGPEEAIEKSFVWEDYYYNKNEIIKFYIENMNLFKTTKGFHFKFGSYNRPFIFSKEDIFMYVENTPDKKGVKHKTEKSDSYKKLKGYIISKVKNLILSKMLEADESEDKKDVWLDIDKVINRKQNKK